MDSNSFIKSLNEMGIAIIDGTLEALDERFMASILTNLNHPIVFDVGAHQGNFCKMIFDINPKSSIFAFEPNKASFKKLSEFIAPPAGKLHLYNCAVSSTEGTAVLYYSSEQSDSPLSSLHRGVIEDLNQHEAHSEPVTVRTLDSVFKEVGLSGIHLLKLDLEGNELEALKGAKELLASKKIQAIHFEFNEMNVISRTFFKDFWDLLSPNYTISRLCPEGMLHISHYMPMFCEQFAIQSIVAMAK